MLPALVSCSCFPEFIGAQIWHSHFGNGMWDSLHTLHQRFSSSNLCQAGGGSSSHYKLFPKSPAVFVAFTGVERGKKHQEVQTGIRPQSQIRAQSPRAQCSAAKLHLLRMLQDLPTNSHIQLCQVFRGLQLQHHMSWSQSMPGEASSTAPL